MECEKREVSKGFGLSNWKDGVFINRDGEDFRTEQSRVLGRVQEFCSRLIKFLRFLIDMLIEMSSHQLNI